MSNITLHGIANCDTIKKAKQWLNQADIAFTFRDYKKHPPTVDELAQFADMVGWENLINKRGTTWRKLPSDEQANLDIDKALRLLAKHPSMIKRPLLMHKDQALLGFSDLTYTDFFA